MLLLDIKLKVGFLFTNPERVTSGNTSYLQLTSTGLRRCCLAHLAGIPPTLAASLLTTAHLLLGTTLLSARLHSSLAGDLNLHLPLQNIAYSCPESVVSSSGVACVCCLEAVLEVYQLPNLPELPVNFVDKQFYSIWGRPLWQVLLSRLRLQTPSLDLFAFCASNNLRHLPPLLRGP